MAVQQQRTTLLLSVDKVGDRFVDHAPSATVADLIAALRSNDGLEVPEGVAITVDRTASPLGLSDRLDASDIRSGDFLRFADGVDIDPTAYVSAPIVPEAPVEEPEDVPATLEMLTGPKVGEIFELKQGVNSIGRVSSNDVVIVDPGISRNHGAIVVDGETLTIVDNGSTNGIMVDGTLITDTTTIRSGQQIVLGHSQAAISLQKAAGPAEPAEPLPLSFEPGTRTNHPYEGQQVLLPRPPDPESRGRRREFLSGRNQNKTAKELFDQSIAALTERMSADRDLQRQVRLAESPSINELIAAVPHRTHLWTTSVVDPGAMVARIGLADVQSRTRFVAPDGGQEDLRVRLAELVDQLSIIPRAPACIDLAESGTVGLHGPIELARDLAYSMVAQLALNLGPHQLGVLTKPGPRRAEWDWLKWLPHGHFTGSFAGVTAEDFESTVVRLLDGRPMASGIGRPPAVLVVIDDDRPLSVDVLNRLLEDGPDLEIYSVLLRDISAGFDHPLGAMINVSPGSADLQRNGETEIGNISLETADVLRLVSLVRNIAPLRYLDDSGERSAAGEPASNGQQHAEVTIGTFELGGPPPPGQLPMWRLGAAPADFTPAPAPAPVVAEQAEAVPVPPPPSSIPAPPPPAPAAAPAPAPAPALPPPPTAESQPTAAPPSEPLPGPNDKQPTKELPVASYVPKAPTMPERPLDITSLPHAKEDSRLVLGTVSAPGLPSAAVFALNLAHDGVLAVGGPSGAGKTTALRAVAVAAGLVRVPDDEKPSVCYLDGRDGLGDLDSLPHAEGGGQRTLERTQSVAVDLERLVAERSVMLERGDGPAATFEQHRSEHPGSGLRRVVVLVDDVKAVTAMFDAQHPGRFGELFDRILTDGSRLGVHLVFSVMDRSEIGEERADMVGRWLMLGDGAIGGPRPPGRAVVGNSEVRFATAEIAPVGDADSSAGADSSADAGPVSAAEPDAEQSQGAA